MREPQLSAQQAVVLVARHFGTLDDPRVDRTKRHPLLNILVFSLTGALCGAEGWEDLEAFAEAKRPLFEGLLDMPDGTPSADTFRRVFGALHPARFEECFTAWVAALGEQLEGQVVAFDGKSVRSAVQGSAAKGHLQCLHVLHAWASDSHLLLAQTAVEGAPGEVAAIPQLIGQLELSGAVVTTDANGCTRDVAAAAVEAGADYVLGLKGNRGALHTRVKEAFAALPEGGGEVDVTAERGHGREEVRRVSALPLTDWPLKGERWAGATTAVRVQRFRAAETGSSVEEHFYLSSLPASALVRLGDVVRAHWGVENGLHWVLDVAFGEDTRRIRDRTAARNWGLVQKMALNLLKRDTSSKRGIAAKRKKAGWDDAYLLHLLTLGITQV